MTTEETFKWEKLQKEEHCTELRQELRQPLGSSAAFPDDWESGAAVLRETPRNMFGASSDLKKED